ncbi:MAG: hypothetical protein AAGA22_05600 [Pseudomonadota bacterium]
MTATPPTSPPRYNELREAIKTYGDAAFQNLIRCRALAREIVTQFSAYEGCPPEAVALVPATGAFDPRQKYGDAAFNFSAREIVILEPLRFGLCLVVGNVEDAGSLWLRTVVSIEMSVDGFDIFVSERPKIRIPLQFEGKLDPVFAEIHKEFLETFTREVNEFNDVRFGSGIGFIPTS